MEEREDIYSGNAIEWRWVVVGSLIVIGTQTLIGAVLSSLGVEIASLSAFVMGVTVGFLVGGFVIGWMSPGYTAWEAGFASVLAAAGSVFVAAKLLAFAGGLMSLIPVAVGWGLLCGLLGGFLGEKVQSALEG